MNDGSVKIFFNSNGKDACESTEEITDAQDNFLRFMETGETSDDFTRKLGDAVGEVRANRLWREEYMKEMLRMQEAMDRALKRE